MLLYSTEKKITQNQTLTSTNRRAHRPRTAFRASGRVVPAGCMGRVHDSPIVYSLLREGSHPPHPLTAERGGAIFGTCLWGYVIARAVDLGQGGGCWCLMLRWLFGTEDFEYYNTQPQRK